MYDDGIRCYRDYLCLNMNKDNVVRAKWNHFHFINESGLLDEGLSPSNYLRVII